MAIKVVQGMDRQSFRTICEMGAEVASRICDQLKERGLEEGNGGNVLLVALAGLMMGGDLTDTDIVKGLEIARSMWVRTADGYSLRSIPDKDPSTSDA